MMTWTPSPADEVPNPAGISSLRKLFGFSLSRNARSKGGGKGTQSKGEETGQQSQQEQELQEQELKEEGEERADPEDSDLSADIPGDFFKRARQQCLPQALGSYRPCCVRETDVCWGVSRGRSFVSFCHTHTTSRAFGWGVLGLLVESSAHARPRERLDLSRPAAAMVLLVWCGDSPSMRVCLFLCVWRA